MDKSGKTALHYAAANEHSGEDSSGMYDWLLQMGADKEHEDNVSVKLKSLYTNSNRYYF